MQYGEIMAKNSINTREIWDREAEKALKSKPPPEWYSYYVGRLYRKAVELALRHLSKSTKQYKINLLKADLWNEGIETSRDILGHIKSLKTFDFYGIDISPFICLRAKSRISNLQVVVGDIRSLPFRNNSFDVLLDLSTLDHVPENEVVKVLDEYVRILRGEGILSLIFWYKNFYRKYIQKVRDTITQYYFSLRFLRNEISRRFHIISEYYINLQIPKLGFILDRLLPPALRNKFLNLLLRLEYSSFKIILKNFAGLCFILCEKREKKSVEEVKSYWDQRIRRSKGSWEGVLWEGLPAWNTYIDKLQMHYLKPIFAQIKPSHSVLDLGCGVGRFTFRLANRCKEIYGVDSSATAIQYCRKKIKNSSNIKFEIMDVRDLKFDNEKFDWTLSITVLQHVTSETDFIIALKEVFRVTRKGGKIVLIECTTDKRKDEFVISLSRSKWFQIIEQLGGKIEYWCGLDVPLLRKIIFHCFTFMKNIRGEKVRSLLEQGLINLLKVFEYTIPKIFKNISWYTLIVVTKQ